MVGGAVKTTIELPDSLPIEAKMAAAERRTTIRAIGEQALRRELQEPSSPAPDRIGWVNARCGLPTDFNVADRAAIAGTYLG
jgi:hypothetical protein